MARRGRRWNNDGVIKRTLPILLLLVASSTLGQQQPIEVHERLAGDTVLSKRVALTLDACSGRFDDDLIGFLIRHRIPATIFATKRWLDRNPEGVAIIRAHLDLFDVEDHGENHIPAVIGASRKPCLSHYNRSQTATPSAKEPRCSAT